MEKKITNQQLAAIATNNGFEFAAVKAIVMVEGSGSGFDAATEKILIQFEPSWYKRLDAKDGFSGHGVWEENKVEKQSAEWIAFNDAFSKDSDAAMMATSWGIMQVMGFHYRDIGFNTVGEMVDFAKVSESNQVELGIRFIKKNARLNDALKKKDWSTFAYYYNGEQYKKFNYDNRMMDAYNEAVKIKP